MFKLVIGVALLSALLLANVSYGDEGCGGDPNAESGCKGNCGNTCTTYNWTDAQKRARCVHTCISGCKCKIGYVYDENAKKCVLLEDCSS